MFHRLAAYFVRLMKALRKGWLATWPWFKRYWKKNVWHKIVAIVCGFLILSLGAMYGIARWYMWSERGHLLTLGATFVPGYAQSLGVDPQQTFEALINDLHVKQFRLVSYWSDIEPTKGQYDFSQLDWEMKDAEAAHVKITLTVGLRQPRWPECHMPSWAANEPQSEWQPQLEAFMTAVVNRYKNSPSLGSWQVENEYFLQGFGTCKNFSRQRLIDEAALVKKLDPKHSIIIGRSNNGVGTPIGQPTPDVFSISIYKRVWDGNLTHRYLEYPFPAWYYGFLAGTQKILTGKDMVIGELQAEPWPPKGQGITSISLNEANKSLSANMLADRFTYGEATGMKTIDMWGAEYWYYRKVKLNDPSLWNVAMQAYAQSQACIQTKKG